MSEHEFYTAAHRKCVFRDISRDLDRLAADLDAREQQVAALTGQVERLREALTTIHPNLKKIATDHIHNEECPASMCDERFDNSDCCCPIRHELDCKLTDECDCNPFNRIHVIPCECGQQWIIDAVAVMEKVLLATTPPTPPPTTPDPDPADYLPGKYLESVAGEASAGTEATTEERREG